MGQRGRRSGPLRQTSMHIVKTEGKVLVRCAIDEDEDAGEGERHRESAEVTHLWLLPTPEMRGCCLSFGWRISSTSMYQGDQRPWKRLLLDRSKQCVEKFVAVVKGESGEAANQRDRESDRAKEQSAGKGGSRMRRPRHCPSNSSLRLAAKRQANKHAREFWDGTAVVVQSWLLLSRGASLVLELLDSLSLEHLRPRALSA